MNRLTDTETLLESFSALADEVQNLIDRKTILEHKLRFAAEQYQYLADKYAPAAPEISETLAKLQLPPDLQRPSTSGIPLPKRGQTGSNQHQIALWIRDGRRAAQQLALRAAASSAHSGKESKDAASGAASALSTIMEQDFTVAGKQGMLQCPFSVTQREQQLQRQQEQLLQQQSTDAAGRSAAQPVTVESAGDDPSVVNAADPTPHSSAVPICAAMFEEAKSQTAPSSTGAAKCPIRYLDQHSPEEIAHYVETHKHQLPRSHAICVKRYNKNEEQIRKLDAKYGNLVNMISDLGQLHQPMLPLNGGDVAAEPVDRSELHRTSNERVENWAHAVSVSAVTGSHSHPDAVDGAALERRSRSRTRSHSGGFDGNDADRPLKEVRLGESPSRPWGIAVPLSSLPDADIEPPLSPPAAPVRMPSPTPAGRCPVSSGNPPAEPRKCPFDHTKLGAMGGTTGFPLHQGQVDALGVRGLEEHGKASASAAPEPSETEHPFASHKPRMPQMPRMPPMPQTAQTTQMPSTASYMPGPAFVNFTPPTTATKDGNTTPQMLFTGPVFIGYSPEQAAQFMYHLQNLQKN